MSSSLHPPKKVQTVPSQGLRIEYLEGIGARPIGAATRNIPPQLDGSRRKYFLFNFLQSRSSRYTGHYRSPEEGDRTDARKEVEPLVHVPHFCMIDYPACLAIDDEIRYQALSMNADYNKVSGLAVALGC